MAPNAGPRTLARLSTRQTKNDGRSSTNIDKPKKKKAIRGGRHWVGIKTKDAVIISAHLIRSGKHDTDVDRSSRLMEGITAMLNKATTEQPDINIVLAIDANTTLMKNTETRPATQ